jgi:hypothetical protein
VKDREIFVSALGDVSVFRQEMDFFGTIRGRVGFTATPTFLIYATGGLAYAGLENRVGFLRNNRPSLSVPCQEGRGCGRICGWRWHRVPAACAALVP